MLFRGDCDCCFYRQIDAFHSAYWCVLVINCVEQYLPNYLENRYRAHPKGIVETEGNSMQWRSQRSGSGGDIVNERAPLGLKWALSGIK